MVGNVRKVLGGFEFGIAFHDPLLPSYLIEIFIIEDAADPLGVFPALPIFGDCDELGHVVHLHRSVTDECDDGSIGMGELGSDGVGDGSAHGSESS